MIVRSRRSVRWRAVGAVSLVLAGAVLVPDGHPATAVPASAEIVTGFVEPDPVNHSRIVIHGVGFKRIGLYGVTVNGTPRKAVSVSVDNSSSTQRHKRPAANELVQFPNITNSALLDYALWRYGSTADPSQASGLQLLAWHLSGQTFGTPTIGSIGPGDAGWGPPTNVSPGIIFLIDPNDVTGAPLPADANGLGDVVEQAAKDIVSSSTGFLGPWSLDLTLAWGSHQGTVLVRSASNTPVPGIGVALASPNSVVPATVTTDANGEATFTFNPSGDSATVTATAAGPGVHTEWDVAGETLGKGYQRIAVGQQAPLTDSFTVHEPQITTYAKDAVDGDKTVGAGGSIIDTVQYQNLTPGATYTARVTWQYQDNAEASTLSATRTFVAAAGGTGNIDVGPVITGPEEVGRSLVAYEFLYSGDTINGFPDVIHANINDQAQTVSVQSVQMITAARDTYDGDSHAFPGGNVIDTLAYLGLAPGGKYTTRAEWHYTDGLNDLGPTGLTTTKTFFADPSGFGTVDVGPVTLNGDQTGTQIVAFQRLYAGDAPAGVPLGIHEEPGDPNQTITVGNPTVLTIASDVADGDHNVEALGQVQDDIVFANLQPGLLYTAVMELHLTDGGLDLGSTGLTASTTFTPSAITGNATVGPIRLTGPVSGQRLVAFERIYVGTNTSVSPIARHEVAFDPGQALFVEPQTISTEATEGTAQGIPLPGDKEIAIGTDSTIVDTVTVQLQTGTPVVALGAMARYEDGVCSDPIITVTQPLVVLANKTFRVVYPVPEAPGEYVLFVVVQDTNGHELVEHQDCTAESQRVLVTAGDLPATR